MDDERRHTGMRTLLRSFLLLSISALVALSCSSGGDEAAGLAALDGEEYWSVEVTENGVARSLVDGTRISLRFDGDQLGANAGCNSMGGTFEIEDATLNTADLFTTEMGCDPERHAQDEFLISVLMAAPTMELVGDELTLTTPDVAMRLLNTAVANPDREILGTTWIVSGFIDGQSASSFAVGERGRIELRADSTLAGFDGCAEFAGSVEVADGSTGGPVEGDGEMQFGPIARQVVDDCADAAYADAVHRLFATGDATYTIDGTNMTVLNSDGTGVTFSAR